jgi:hypothetical protein
MYVPFNGSSVLDSLIRQNIRRLPEALCTLFCSSSIRIPDADFLYISAGRGVSIENHCRTQGIAYYIDRQYDMERGKWLTSR